MYITRRYIILFDVCRFCLFITNMQSVSINPYATHVMCSRFLFAKAYHRFNAYDRYTVEIEH